MAKLTSPSQLSVGVELSIDTAAKTFTLSVAGGLNAKEGVTIQALYSKFVALWATAAYNEYPFPMYAIDALSGQFQFGTDGATYNGWKPADDATRQKLRDGGWSEYNAAGTLARQYVGIVSLGEVSVGSQLYYQRVSSDAPTNFTFDDEVNEGIQVYGNVAADATTTTFDKRAYFKGFVREYEKKYKDSVLADTGKTATGAYIVNMLLSNEADLDIKATDGTAGGATDPWQKMKLRYFGSAFQKDVDTAGTPRSFGIVIDVGTHSGIDGSGSSGTTAFSTAAGGMTATAFNGGSLKIHNGPAKGTYAITSNTATGITLGSNLLGAASGASFTAYPASPVSASLQQIYTWVQYKLRQNSDIDDTGGTVIGKTAGLLLNFVGPVLKCGFYQPTNPNGGGAGVIVEGISSSDINSITFYDNNVTLTAREYPKQSAGKLNFNSALVGGYYRLYFTTLPGASNDYGEANAVTVDDAAGADIAGTISGAAVDFTFDYTNNVQGGRTGNADAGVTLVAGRPGFAKPVVATGTITDSKSISITATAEQDRAYTS